MAQRNHPLKVGEIVYDNDFCLFGVIVELDDKHAVLDMSAVPADGKWSGWCEQENLKYFVTKLEEEDLRWEQENLNQLYQMAWDIVDCQEGNVVCYEHNDIGEGYPYFSPYHYENLYNFETEKK